jgi:hypothetical protein
MVSGGHISGEGRMCRVTCLCDGVIDTNTIADAATEKTVPAVQERVLAVMNLNGKMLCRDRQFQGLFIFNGHVNGFTGCGQIVFPHFSEGQLMFAGRDVDGNASQREDIPRIRAIEDDPVIVGSTLIMDDQFRCHISNPAVI